MSNELVKFTPAVPLDLAEVATFEITGTETAEIAVEYREGVKALRDEIEAAYRPHIQNAHRAHKALCDELTSRLLPVKVTLDALDRTIGQWELARRQREEKARREAEAEVLAQAARDRAADAERQRAKGNEALAREIERAPVEEFAAPVVVEREQRTKGVSVVAKFVAEVTDFDALVKFAGGDDCPSVLRAMLLSPNEKGLAALVKQMGEGFNVPGVKRVEDVPQVRSTGRRS